MVEKKQALGRGLDALFADEEVYEVPSETKSEKQNVSNSDLSGNIVLMPIELLRPGKYQPRKYFKDEALGELCGSIKTHGVLQPLLVRPIVTEEDVFEIIAGERRWRASQMAQLHEVPVIVQSMTDKEAMEIGLIENLQRQDLSPIEEAKAYKQLIDDFGYTQEKLADSVGKGRSHLANTMRLLLLPDPVQDLVIEGSLSAGHARALINSDDAVKLAQNVIKKGLSVRQTEKLVASHGVEKRSKKPAAKTENNATIPNADIKALEDDIERILGLKVKINATTHTSGSITIDYTDLDQLDDVLNRLMNQNPERMY